MAQTYKYTIEGNTQPAVASNESLDQSINQVDNSTKQLSTDVKQTGVDAQQAFGRQLETKIKTIDGAIKGFGGTVSLLTGTLSTVIGSLGLFGVENENIESFQRAALSAIALGSGLQQSLTGLKDLTEAQKIQNELTATATGLENRNTAALGANAAAAGGVTAALGNAAVSIEAETLATSGNTTAKGVNTAAQAANSATVGAGTTILFTNAAATETLTIATSQLTIAQRVLNVVAKANPYIAIGSVILGVGAAIYSLTSTTKDNTEAEEANAEARAKNEASMRSEEDASLRLSRARGASAVALAEETLQIIKQREERATDEYVAAQVENRFSQRTKDAREAVIAARKEIEIAEAELAQARAKQAADDAKNAETQAAANKKRNEELRNERFERQGILNLIRLEIEESLELLTKQPSEGSILDVRNLKSVEESLKGIYQISKDLVIELEDEPIEFLSREQLDILKRLRGELDTELQQQLYDREQQYKDELALFAGNEDAKTKLTEEYEQDRAKIRRQYAIQTAREIVGITSDFLGVIADINQQSLELQLAQAAGNQAAIDRINADALERQKKLRIAQTLVTTAESILNGFNATSTLPPPFNFIAGGVLAAAYAALGAKTIQTINSTTLEGGSSAGGYNNIPSGGAAFGSINLGGAAAPNAPFPTGILPGVGGGRLGGPTGVGETQMPIRAYVLAGDVENGVQANLALNNRRRLAG